MQTMNSFRTEMGVVLSTTILRLTVAAILGGIIGLERQLKHKPAGLRTNMFICFGSALFTRSEEHTSELQSRLHLVCRLLLEKKKKRQSVDLNSFRSYRACLLPFCASCVYQS